MKSKWSWSRFRPVVVKYVVAVLFVAAATIITAALRRTFPATPGSLLFCAVILSAWFGGWGPGLFASILSTVAGISLPPPLTTGSDAGSMITRFIIFLFTSLFISWICSEQRRAQAALQQAHEELEQRVNERTRALTAANEELKSEIAGRKRTETLLAGQKQVLEMIAANAPLSESLAGLMCIIEAQVPGMLGSILLLDEKGVHFRHGVAPSLPREYMNAIYGLPIGPEAGSCGTAAYCREAVFVEDIATDPRWKDYRAAALPHGLRACWSTPIFDAQRHVLGTFAMYYRQPALPEPEHLRVIELATHIAAIAISSDRAQARLRESEGKLKEAQRIANIGYWDRDLLTGRIVWSAETCRIFGLPPHDYDFSQEKLQELIHPDDRQLQRRALADALQGKGLYDVEYRIVRPSGELRIVHARDEIEYDESRRPIRMFGTVQDITERKKAEEALSESEKKFSKLFQSSPIAISLSTVNEGRYLDVNEEFLRMVQRTRDEVVGHTAVEIGIWADSEQRAANIARIQELEVGRNAELEIRGQFGQITHILWSAETLIIGGESCLLGSSLDITERKRAEKLLFAQAQEIKAIVENSPDIIVRFDRDLRRTYVNPAFIKASGVPREALLGREIASAAKDGAVNATKEEVEILERSLKQVLETGRPLQFESTWPLQTGHRIFSVHLEPEFDAHGAFTSILGISRDVTEHRRAEEAVRESQQLLNLVLATLPVGVMVTDQAGDIVLANEASKRIWGNTIASGRERWAQSKGFWHDSGKKIESADWASVRALSKGQTSLNELIDIETCDGQQKTIQNFAAPIHNAEGKIVGAVIVNEDVTERVRAAEALHQTQLELTRVARLTTMGELTASIAHEVNQPLAAVVTNANAISRWLAAAPPNLEEARKAVQRIARDGDRASEVIKRIRALMKKSEPARIPLNLNELIQETVTLTQAELTRKKVSLKIKLAPDLPRVPADRVQLQQVLLNLVVNAIDSLGGVADRPRVLRICTDRSEPDAVHISVQDTGAGIKPQENEHLFEPFYTTKPNGLGMGLAISRSIVEAHGGRLWAEPNNGRGATFQFTMPIHDGGTP
jgi:PAS domain S-box-containing protein